MQLTFNRVKNVASSQIGNLNKFRQHIQTYSKRKKVLLLTVLLIVPLGTVWVLLIIKADEKIKNTLIRNGKAKK
jgi:hypothetical protein